MANQNETPGIVRVGDVHIPAGMSKRADLPVAQLPTQNQVSIPIQVVNGVENGPKLWVNAAIHGDEINGVEIVRELLGKLDPQQLCGTVFAVPIVNVFGFVYESRYLPDRRDLNRSFPGSARGSLAARLANLFMTEIVDQCTHGIDLHTGSNERINLPHIRGDLGDDETRRCAEAFGAPVMIDSQGPRGSLRRAVRSRQKPILVFEGGEPRRFNPDSVEVGLEGILRVMNALGMRDHTPAPLDYEPREADRKVWLRAKRAGILRLQKVTGDFVKKGECLGTIGDAFEAVSGKVNASFDGLIISHVNNPLVHQGDAVIHLAQLK
jgi:predicted deacylase